MKLQETVSGFRAAACRALPELEAKLWRLEHAESGAELFWLDRPDDNMTFAIAFRTPPEDDTGVFHILEHAVLCGSDRYPVKDPFVELMKGSLSTFLNAMTFPDRTVYPVSSGNRKDLLNLMRVYMDAVLHPRILSHPEAFRQEGWHFAFDRESGEVSHTGVVLNEMRGALSAPGAILQRRMVRQLFPDTCLRYDSGGDPAHIPELTYERFLACHRRYYHPSNACLFLDGRLDIEEALRVLHGEFLSGYARREATPPVPIQPPVRPAPLRARYEAPEGEETADRSLLAWGYVLEDRGCQEELTAVQALSDVLCGGSQTPLSRRVLSAGLAQDVTLDVVDGIRQPFAMLTLWNTDESRAAQAEAALREELARQAAGALDRGQLAASLAGLEFQMRERSYGATPRGVAFALDVLAAWAHGGDPAAGLEAGPLFASLNRKLEEGWFEALLERLFLRSGHTARVLLVPSAALGREKRAEEARRLQAAKDGWSPEREALLRAREEELAAWQAAGDPPEALASLPRLALSDLPREPEEVPTEAGEVHGVPLLRHDLAAGGIRYVELYFDMTDLTAEELSLASLLTALLGELETRQYGAMELQRLCRLNTGGIYFSVESYSRLNCPETCKVFLCASFSAVEDRLEKAAGLTAGFLLDTRFDDREKLRELLRQYLMELRQSIAAEGSGYAAARISAGCSAEGAVREYTEGVSYYLWLKALERDFDDRAPRLQEELEALCRRLFTAGRLTVSVTGGSAGAAMDCLLARLPAESRRERSCAVKPWGPRREGIVLPTDVSFAALGGSLLRCGAPYGGGADVMCRVVSLVHLWNTVRVRGGAYGTALRQDFTGAACFHSYRDPDAVHSLACFRQAADFLEAFCASGPDLTGPIIGAVSASQLPLLPRQKGKAADGFYLRGITREDRRRIRGEMLAASPEALAALAGPLGRMLASPGVCVAGPRRQLEACGDQLDTLTAL